MALPTSGPLKFSTIYTELYGSHTTQLCSLRNMSADANFTVPDSVSEFYGYTSKSLSVSQTEFTGVTFRGGTGIVSFDVVSNSVNWSASATTNPSSFITIQSGDDSGGDGTKTVDLNIASNSDKNNTRYGEVTISDDDTNDPVADIVVKITQNKQYYFSVTESFELAAAANSSDSVSLSTNVSNWTASVFTNFSDNSLSVSSSGNTLTVTVSTENTASSPRNGEIKVHDNSTADPADDLIITVSQAGALNISVSPNNFTGVTWRSTTKQSTVTSTNVNWTESHDTSIISNVSPSNGGNGDTNITISIKEHTNTSVNQAVTISGSGITKYVSITQNYKRYISASNKTFDYDATSGTITVGGNVLTTWDIATSTSNFITSITRQNDTTIAITMNENTSTSDITDTITLEDNGTDPADNVTIAVTQEGVPLTISVSPTSHTYAYNSTSTYTYNVTSNVTWTATASQNSSYITVGGGQSVTGDGTFTIKFNDANTDKSNTKVSTVIVSDDSGVATSVVVTVTQSKALYKVTLTLDFTRYYSGGGNDTMYLDTNCGSSNTTSVYVYAYKQGNFNNNEAEDITQHSFYSGYQTADITFDLTNEISFNDNVIIETQYIDNSGGTVISGGDGELAWYVNQNTAIYHMYDTDVTINGSLNASYTSCSVNFKYDTIDSAITFKITDDDNDCW